jgi:predicted transcriptional regulator
LSNHQVGYYTHAPYQKNVRLIEITKELDEDRTKVLFHLKKLQESGIVEHDRDNVYSLTTGQTFL